MKAKRVILIFIYITIFFGFSYLLFSRVPFEGTLENIGIYKFILIPILSIFGCNILTSSFLYPALFFLHQSGMNLFILSGLTTIGATTGDLLFLFFGHKINEHSKREHKVTKFFRKNKDSDYIKLFIFLYAAFFPMSNEFMTLGLGYIEYPFKKTVPPLILGNILYYTILIWLGGNFLGWLF